MLARTNDIIQMIFHGSSAINATVPINPVHVRRGVRSVPFTLIFTTRWRGIGAHRAEQTVEKYARCAMHHSERRLIWVAWVSPIAMSLSVTTLVVTIHSITVDWSLHDSRILWQGLPRVATSYFKYAHSPDTEVGWWTPTVWYCIQPTGYSICEVFFVNVQIFEFWMLRRLCGILGSQKTDLGMSACE